MYAQELCLLATVVICAIDLFIAYNSFKKGNKLGRSLGYTCLTSAVVTISYYFSIVFTDYFAASVATSVYFFSIDIVLNFMLIFTVFFTGVNTKRGVRLLHAVSSVCCAVDFICLAINPFCEISMSYILRNTVISHYEYSMHLMYRLHLVYCYLLIALIALIIINKAISLPVEYGRKYYFTIFALSVIVWINSIFLFVPNGSALHLIDFSIIGYTLAELFLYWTCFMYPRRGMLNSLRNGIFENVDQGIVLFDIDDKLVMRNRSAKALLPAKALWPETTIENFAALSGIDLSEFDGKNNYSMQFYSEIDGIVVPLRCDYSKMFNRRGKQLGKLFIMSEASRENDRITGFLNFDAFQKVIQKTPEMVVYPAVIAEFDINRLADVNHSKGNDVGDKYLKELANLIREGFGSKARFIRGTDARLFAISGSISENEARTIADTIKTGFPLSIEYAVGIADGEHLDIFKAVDNTNDTLHIKKMLDKNSSHSALVSSLTSTMEEWDEATRLHLKRTQTMCSVLGEKLGLSDADASRLALFAILHDVGKIGIPIEILHKPGWMTEDEKSILRSHVIKGYQIANNTPELRDIAALIRAHHERWDGKGYPDRLKHEDIPFLSRIVCIVDSYDAMTHERTYKKPMSPEAAKRELIRCAGTQFDPQIVECFVDVLNNVQFHTDYNSSAVSEEVSVSTAEHEKTDENGNSFALKYSRYILDENMRVVSADENFFRITGYTQADIDNGAVSQGDLIPPEERAGYFSNVKEMLKSSSLAVTEHKLVRKDGSSTYVVCIGRVYFDAAAMAERSEICISDFNDARSVNTIVQKTQRELQERYRMLAETAQHDSLTGLLNHSAFLSEVIKTTEDDNIRTLFIIMDIDDFKNVNDNFGHPAGDELIMTTSEILLSDVDNGIVGRLGGDEFAALLVFDKSAGEEQMHARGRALFESLNRRLGTAENACTISMGAGVVDPRCDFSTVYEHVDRALYYSKKHGKHCYSSVEQIEKDMS